MLHRPGVVEIGLERFRGYSEARYFFDQLPSCREDLNLGHLARYRIPIAVELQPCADDRGLDTVLELEEHSGRG
ncbi:hypothetical protein D3C71_2019820 [compost metagenome]